MTKSNLFASFAVSVLLGSTVPAAASVVIDNTAIGRPIDVTYDGFVTLDGSGGVLEGVGAHATFTLTQMVGTPGLRTDFYFDYSITNTSAQPVKSVRLSSFGFNTSISIGSIGFDLTPQLIYGGVSFLGLPVDFLSPGANSICLYSTDNVANGCNMSKGGLNIGDPASSQSFKWTSLDTDVTSFSIDRFFVHYQDLLSPETNLHSASGLGFTRFTPAVPEPSSWALMLAGFGTVGYAMRRRRNVRVSFA